MTRTGFFEENQTHFPDNSSAVEVVATINHINNNNLAAAKMYLEILPDFENKDTVINLLRQCLQVNKDAIEYLTL